MKKSAAILDLTILGLIFLSILSLRFLNIPNIGPLMMGISFPVIWFLLHRRGQKLKDIGLFKPDSWRNSFKSAGFVAVIILVATFAGFGVFGALFGTPSPGAAITQQLDNFFYVLFDIFILTWIFTAIGEEVFFRGFLLDRFQTVFAGFPKAPILAVGAQAIWFGSGHISQGLTGILTTGLIGFALGLYFINQKQPRSLAHLIIGHAFIDTFSLSANYISKVIS